MADSGGRSKAKGKATRKGRAGGRKPYTESDLISAIDHPLRRQILRLMHSSNDPLSPTQIEGKVALGNKLSNVSYHVTVLARYHVIALVGRRQVRGALEHFYESQVSEVAWLRGLMERTKKEDEAASWSKRRLR